MLGLILHYVVLILVGYLCVMTVVASGVAVHQEYKIWNQPQLPSLNPFGMVKVFLYNMLWMILCFIGCIIILIKNFVQLIIYTVLRSRSNHSIEYDCSRLVEYFVAKFCTTLFIGNVRVDGTENLPPPSESTDVLSSNEKQQNTTAPIYIANHSSQLDVGAVYYINRRYKWIAKQSVLYLPGVGQIMYLGNHILINRPSSKSKSKPKDENVNSEVPEPPSADNKVSSSTSSSSSSSSVRASVQSLYEKASEALRQQIPLFIFPQGTRCMHKKLGFKDGAFHIATSSVTTDSHSTIVPISINIPYGKHDNIWNSWYPFNLLGNGSKIPTIILTIHPPVFVKDKATNISELKQLCQNTIYSVLPRDLYEDDNKKKTS